MNVGVGTFVGWTRDDDTQVEGRVIELLLIENVHCDIVPFLRIETEDDRIFGIYADPASLKRHNFSVKEL